MSALSHPAPRPASDSSQSPASGRPPGGDAFDRAGVLTVSGLHFAHDVYGAFISALLPLLIERFGLPLSMAGVLVSAFRLPSVLQPFLGYWADRYDARLLVVWAPAATAIAISVLGLAPGYLGMIVLLLVAGLSSACFHPAAGALVTRVGGNRWGRASAYFMTGGELGRAIGPVFIATAVAALALEGLWILAAPAILASIYGYTRIAGRNARIPKPPPPAALRAAIAARRGPLLLMCLIVLLRSLTLAGFQTYLPTFMTQSGASLQFAGLALTLYEVGGVAGAFLGGSLSDRFGRRALMLASQVTAGPVLFAALIFAQEPVGLGLLVVGGFLALSSGSVQLALMQELLPGNRSVAAGLTYFLSFESAVITTLAIGLAADAIGLSATLTISVLISMASLPFTLLLPSTTRLAGGGH